MKKYRVVLPVQIGETTHQFGAVVELDDATAREYAHALIACEEAEEK